MRQYELAYIIHPDLDETAFKEAVERIQGLIEDCVVAKSPRPRSSARKNLLTRSASRKKASMSS